MVKWMIIVPDKSYLSPDVLALARLIPEGLPVLIIIAISCSIFKATSQWCSVNKTVTLLLFRVMYSK